MDIAKIRVKVGEHEFEAEGDAQSVQNQFEAFQKIISSIGQSAPRMETTKPPYSPAITGDSTHISLERIMQVQGRVVSLTVMPSGTDDAALLILLGNKDLRNNETVTGQEVGDGLAQSGRPVPRVDRVMDKMITEAYVLKSGFKRSTRYRLSNSGHQKALAMARDLIATLP